MPKVIGLLFWLDGGVCSQNSAHSFWVAGRPLPLCARDLGLFGGFLLAIALLDATRAPVRPSPAWLAGVLPLVVDGLNSLAHDALDASLYPPDNALRLATGLLAGGALALALPQRQTRFGQTERATSGAAAPALWRPKAWFTSERLTAGRGLALASWPRQAWPGKTERLTGGAAALEPGRPQVWFTSERLTAGRGLALAPWPRKAWSGRTERLTGGAAALEPRRPQAWFTSERAWALAAALLIAVVMWLGGAYGFLAITGTVGIVLLLVHANRLVLRSGLAPLALALPELAGLAAVKHLLVFALH